MNHVPILQRLPVIYVACHVVLRDKDRRGEVEIRAGQHASNCSPLHKTYSRHKRHYENTFKALAAANVSDDRDLLPSTVPRPRVQL